MQARVERSSDLYIIHLSGRLDVETAEPFRQACLSHLSGKKVIFDFRGVSFVGSSGILPFLETMLEFAKKNENRFKFSGVSSEFRKLFAATPLNVIEIHDSPQLAVRAFLNPVILSSPIEAAPMIDESAGEYGLLGLSRESRKSEEMSSDLDEAYEDYEEAADSGSSN